MPSPLKKTVRNHTDKAVDRAFIHSQQATAQLRVRGFCVIGSLSFAGCSVLIVEDEPPLALGLRQSFEAVGAYVFTATQFAPALALAEHPDLALAVLDYRIADETSVTEAVCNRERADQRDARAIGGAWQASA